MSYTAGQVTVWNGSGWALATTPLWQSSYASVTSYTLQTFINYPGTAHTWSNWLEVIGTANAGQAFSVQFGCSVSGQNTATLIEFAKGSAGSEQSIIGPIAVGSWTSTTGQSQGALFLPYELSDGDRISARIQGARTTGSATIRNPISINASNITGATAMDVFTVSTATSRGVALSASANVYVEVTGSATNTYGAIIVVPSGGTSGMNNTAPLLTIATGAAGAEVDVVTYAYRQDTGEAIYSNRFTDNLVNQGNMYMHGTANNTNTNAAHKNNVIPVWIPQGTRVAAKTNTANPNADVSIIGIRP